MMALRRCPSYSLGWGTPHDHKMHSYWSVILSTLLTTPLYHHHVDYLPRGMSSSAVLRPLYTHVTKIGLIDLDDLTKEDTRHTCGMQYHLLHHRRKGITEVIRQIAFGSFQLAWQMWK